MNLDNAAGFRADTAGLAEWGPPTGSLREAHLMKMLDEANRRIEALEAQVDHALARIRHQTCCGGHG